MKKLSTCLFVCLLASQANAGPITFSDEATFLGTTGSLSLESFESEVATNSRNLSSLDLADFTVSMNAGDTMGVFTGDFFGGHATDGSNYLGFSDGHDYVDYSFDTSINSFGINLTDFGDFGYGSVTFSNEIGDSYTAAISGAANANEQFFGIITDFNFSNVRLSQNISGEFYAVDEIYYGTTGVPEPATFALLGLGFAGIGFVRRKKAS